MTSRFKTIFLNSFIRYMNFNHGVSVGNDSDEKESEIDKDLAAGVEALIRVGKASFWGWDDGYSILFWRWPKEIRQEFRDRCELFVKVNIPRFTKKQRMLVE